MTAPSVLLRDCTYNLGNVPEATAEDLDILAGLGVELLNAQEGRDRRPLIAAWVNEHADWAAVPFEGRGVDDVPQLYRTDRLRLVDWWAREVIADRHLGDHRRHEGAGPGDIHPKSETTAVYQDLLSGRYITNTNQHLVASWTRTRSYLGLKEWKRRRAYGAAQVGLAVGEAHRVTRGVAVSCGDFNADLSFELMRPLTDVLEFPAHRPTHADGNFDHIGFRGRPVVSAFPLVVPDDVGLSSDHRALLLDLELSVRCGWPKDDPAPTGVGSGS